MTLAGVRCNKIYWSRTTTPHLIPFSSSFFTSDTIMARVDSECHKSNWCKKGVFKRVTILCLKLTAKTYYRINKYILLWIIATQTWKRTLFARTCFNSYEYDQLRYYLLPILLNCFLWTPHLPPFLIVRFTQVRLYLLSTC